MLLESARPVLSDHDPPTALGLRFNCELSWPNTGGVIVTPDARIGSIDTSILISLTVRTPPIRTSPQAVRPSPHDPSIRFKTVSDIASPSHQRPPIQPAPNMLARPGYRMTGRLHTKLSTSDYCRADEERANLD